MSFEEDMESLLPEVLIHNLTFDHQEGVVEVTYAELRDQADGVGMLKTVAVERELFYTEVEELEADIRALIDEAVVAIRNEDARKARIKKAMSRFRTDPEEEEDG